MIETMKNNDQTVIAQEKLRKTFERIFWDIDVSKLDFEINQKLIITQTLNYGYLDEIQALFKIYPSNIIKQALEDPIKGVWEPKTYKAFCNLFDVNPQKKAINILLKQKTRKKINKLFSVLFLPQY